MPAFKVFACFVANSNPFLVFFLKACQYARHSMIKKTKTYKNDRRVR